MNSNKYPKKSLIKNKSENLEIKSQFDRNAPKINIPTTSLNTNNT